MKNMDKDFLLQKYFSERNLSQSSINSYISAIKKFEEVTNITIDKLLIIAEMEDKNKVSWKETTIRKHLINFRTYLYKNYKKNTANLYLALIKSIFLHFEIPIQRLPYFSMKQVNESSPIYYDDLPDKDIIKKCIEIANPRISALILLMSSSGLTKVDILKMSIGTFLESTIEYHSGNISMYNLQELTESREDIIPTWKLKRQKTNKRFFTFSSPESTEAILTYLATRKNLEVNSPLFNIGDRYVNYCFKEINDKLHLGKAGVYVKFRPHILRKFHASQLYRAGMAQDKIDLLQGRTPSSVHQSYFKEDPNSLKQEYIKCLPYLVLDESKKFKTALDLEKEKSAKLEESNKLKDEKVNDLENRLDKVEAIFDGVDMNELKHLKRFM